MPTPVQLAFANSAADSAVAAERSTAGPSGRGLPAPFTLSQAIYESGWGAAMPHFNCFGIKRDGYGTGDAYSLTHEYLNGTWQLIPQDFETYDSLTACFADHARLVTTGAPYAPLFQAYQAGGDLIKYVTAVCRIYATDPAYAEQILAEMHSTTVTNAVAAAIQRSAKS